MRDALRSYDRLVAGLSRRELLNITWKLGLAAVLPAGRVAHACSRSRSSRPIHSRLASPRAIPCPTASSCGRGWRPTRSTAAACRWPASKWPGRLRSDRSFATVARKGTTVARPELGHSVHVEANGLEPGREYFYRFRCGGEVSQVGRTKTAPAAGRARRSAPLRGVRLQPLRDRLLHRLPPPRRRAVRLRVPHRRLHLRGPRRRAAAIRRGAPASRAGDLHARGLPQSLRAVQDRSGSDGGPRLRAVHRDLGRPRGGQRLRRRSTTKTTRRPRYSCCAAPPPTRPTTRRCRCARRRCRRARTCGSTAASSSAT